MGGEDFLFGRLRPGSGLVSLWRAEALGLIKTLAGENLALQTGLGKGLASGERRCGRGPDGGVAGGCVPGVVLRAWPNPAPRRTSQTGSRVCTLSRGRAGTLGLPSPQIGVGVLTRSTSPGARTSQGQRQAAPAGAFRASVRGAIPARTLSRDSPVQSPVVSLTRPSEEKVLLQPRAREARDPGLGAAGGL